MRLRQFPSSRRPGFTLIEAMTAVTIVAIACSAMLLSVSQAMQASEASQGTSRANMLAKELMTEISASRWADPDQPGHWGPEIDETRTNTRSAFNDLDDYDGWKGRPQTRNGVDYDTMQQTLFPTVQSHEYGQYTCSVRVEYVSFTGQLLPAGQTSLYRQVTIEVTNPKHAPQKFTRIVYDPAPLLDRSHWFDPNVNEPLATVTIMP